MLMTQAMKWGMLVEDSNDELKSGAAEILLLSRLKDILQAPPQDFQDFPVIIANEVEYVLLDHLVDFMQKSAQDRNVIHEALHDVTEQALAGKDLVNYKVRTVEEDVIYETPLWDGIFMEALHRLTIATSDVDRKRSREEGWKLIAREADVALKAADGHTSSGEEIDRTVSFVHHSRQAEAAGWQEKNLRSDDWSEEAHVILWYRDWRTTFADLVRAALNNVETVSCLEIQHPREDIEICDSRTGQLSHHVQTVIRADNGVDTNGRTRYVIPLSLYSDKTHVDGHQKQTAYPLMMSIAHRPSDVTLLAYLPVLQHRPRDKGWGPHSTAFRKRKTVILHKALSTVLQSAKEASHDGMMVTTERFGEITVHPFVINYIQDYPERCALATVKFGSCPTCTVSKDDLDVIADFTNCRRSQTIETQLVVDCFNSGDNDIRRAAEARMSELDMHKHVEENGLWGFYRGPHGDDPELDYHLALQPDRGNRSTGMTAEAGKRPKRVDEEHLFPFTWKSRRHAISITKRDVLRLGAKQWLNDNVIDMYLQSVYDEHFLDGDNMTLHVCTSFWHPAVIANQNVYVVKAGWQERIKSTSPKLRRISNELRTTSVVLIPVNHENHWKLLLLLNVGQFLAVTEDNDGQKRPVSIVIDSFQQSGRQE
ncbi:hypothetical protein CBR_g24254 [Chara braunii]|uniref:Ubiquitin-like protease family profile domain-containing protein n=1 Tax=Chara braunii TaxID=69332 RepID=A0A388JMC2_CHABU|nr:hypothetical protein CBR_g24254 [Chara braunii]|eukprot:GBG58903.1 hypothetical protein CBR_g24254 [Chara braunii]